MPFAKHLVSVEVLCFSIIEQFSPKQYGVGRVSKTNDDDIFSNYQLKMKYYKIAKNLAR